MKMLRITPIALALLTLAAACGGDELPVGGWSQGGLYACFSSDGDVGLGDHADEALEPACTWTEDGKVLCDDFSATWSLDGDDLLLKIDPPCSDVPNTDDYCGPYRYSPDDDLGCPP